MKNVPIWIFKIFTGFRADRQRLHGFCTTLIAASEVQLLKSTDVPYYELFTKHKN
jgi:hypothetical protein